MKFTKKRKEQIMFYMLEKIFEKDRNFKSKVVEAQEVSINTVYRYLKELQDKGVILKKGDFYELVKVSTKFTYDMSVEKDESEVFNRDILPNISDLPKGLRDIWDYAFTEMFNNVIDHSESSECTVFLTRNEIYTWIEMVDNGVGIFNKIQKFFKQDTIEQVIVDLFKGKMTTDPSRHSGEGIFFTSKIMDRFFAISSNYIFTHSNINERSEYLDEQHPLYNLKGTIILMTLSNSSDKRISDIFNEYSNPDDVVIKTRIPMRFLCDSGYPISRSQAKRLTSGIDKFKEVELDFMDVQNIGQGFADELFRVYSNNNPDIKLIPINTNNAITNMISHVKAKNN